MSGLSCNKVVLDEDKTKDRMGLTEDLIVDIVIADIAEMRRMQSFFGGKQ